MSRFSTAMFLAVIGLLAAEVRAQSAGDVGSPECRAVQLQAQTAYSASLPYRTKNGGVKVASRVVEPYVRSEFITAECSSCIMNQFGRGIPVAEQKTCGPICGNAVCQRGEDSCTCPADCGPSCGNGACDCEETCSNCPLDCGVCPEVCGDGSCAPFVEDNCNCPSDCPPVCGNGVCDCQETCSNCPSECGSCIVCGDGSCDFPEDGCTCSVDCGPCFP